MTVVDREPDVRVVQEGEVSPDRSGGGEAPAQPGFLGLAGLCAAAGVIHLAMAPAHAGEWLPEGLAFAAAGWLQVALAFLLATRATAAVLRVTAAANAVFIVAWLWTRTLGPPFGPEAGVAHAVSLVDVVCVAFEALAVIGAVAVLARPALGTRLRPVAPIAAVAAIVLATAAIVSPSASGHGHDGGHAGTEHDAAGASAAAGGHEHAHESGAPADDKGLSLIMNGAGEGGGHVHKTSNEPLDPATQAQLDGQLAKMRPLIEKYPTIKDAEADGYTRQGPFSPALGTHYMKPKSASNRSETMDDEALANPFLIFDGTDPDSKLAGFMYIKLLFDTTKPPEGFAGPNDHWHYHTNVCVVPRPGGGLDTPLGADTTATKELCDQYPGGHLIPNTGYMVHVWPVPGYESAQGLFSNTNDKITCPDGTYWTVDLENIGNRKNVCRDVKE